MKIFENIVSCKKTTKLLIIFLLGGFVYSISPAHAEIQDPNYYEDGDKKIVTPLRKRGRRMSMSEMLINTLNRMLIISLMRQAILM